MSLTDNLSIPVATSSTPITQSNEESQKRKPGRPKKNPVATANTTTTSNTPKSALDTQERWGEVAQRLVQPTAPTKNKDFETPYNSEEEKLLLETIIKYYETFPNLQNPKIKPGTSIPDLKAELQRCKTELGTVDTYKAFCHLDVLICGNIEKVAVKRMWPLQGLATYAKESQILVENELKELNILLGKQIVLHPAFRYILKTIERINTVKERNEGFLQVQTVQPDIFNKYANI